MTLPGWSGPVSRRWAGRARRWPPGPSGVWMALQRGDDGLQRGDLAAAALQPDVVLAHRRAGTGAKRLLPLVDQVQGLVLLLLQLGQEGGVGGELVARQAGVPAVAGLAGPEPAPAPRQGPLAPAGALRHVLANQRNRLDPGGVTPWVA